MTTERPWVRHELPWLKSGPMHRVHSDARQLLDTFLDAWPYRRLHIDGRAITSRATAHTELARAFGFPDYYGKNWDAFNDCFGDFVEENDGALIAVVWTDMDISAVQAPASTAETGWALLECASGYMPSLAPGTAWSISMDVFTIGGGSDFDKP